MREQIRYDTLEDLHEQAKDLKRKEAARLAIPKAELPHTLAMGHQFDPDLKCCNRFWASTRRVYGTGFRRFTLAETKILKAGGKVERERVPAYRNMPIYTGKPCGESHADHEADPQPCPYAKEIGPDVVLPPWGKQEVEAYQAGARERQAEGNRERGQLAREARAAEAAEVG